MAFSFPHRVSVDDAFAQFIEWLETRGRFAERTRVEGNGLWGSGSLNISAYVLPLQSLLP